MRIDERTAGLPGDRAGGGGRRAGVCGDDVGHRGGQHGARGRRANYARVPLIVLSANRPYELLGTGANQTMEQLGYFGSQVRAAISLGLAEDAPEKLDRSTRNGVRPPAG